MGHLISVEDPGLTPEDHARLVPAHRELRLPTWIIGPPPRPGEPPDQDAEILKVYPVREPPRRLSPEAFHAIIDPLTEQHCGGLPAQARVSRRDCAGEERGIIHMTSDETKVLVRRFVEATNARQLDVLDQLITPNFVRHCQATPQLDIRNLEQFKDFLRQDVATFPDNTLTLTHLLAEGDLAAAWGTYEGTQLGQMGPFPASGKKARADVGAVLRVEHGKVAELWITWDNMAILAQLGHLPAVPTVSG